MKSFIESLDKSISEQIQMICNCELLNLGIKSGDCSPQLTEKFDNVKIALHNAIIELICENSHFESIQYGVWLFPVVHMIIKNSDVTLEVLVAPQSLKDLMEAAGYDSLAEEINDEIFQYVDDEILATKTPKEIAKEYLDEPFECIESFHSVDAYEYCYNTLSKKIKEGNMDVITSMGAHTFGDDFQSGTIYLTIPNNRVLYATPFWEQNEGILFDDVESGFQMLVPCKTPKTKDECDIFLKDYTQVIVPNVLELYNNFIKR